MPPQAGAAQFDKRDFAQFFLLLFIYFFFFIPLFSWIHSRLFRVRRSDYYGDVLFIVDNMVEFVSELGFSPKIARG